MRFSTVVLSLTALVSSAVALTPGPHNTFSDVTIFSPPQNYTVPRTLYARTLLLNKNKEKNDVLLATWENYGPNNDTNPYFPIYESYDGGKSWCERSRVYDQVNGFGARYQPFLYEMSENVGQFKAGDILLSGNFIPDDLSITQIDLYVSHDKGYTWHFVSHVARGGEALPNNGLTPVWEPFIMTYNKQIVIFYSDQRDPKQGQKLVHQVSSDGKTWGPVVNDVAYSTYDWRPGMTTVSKLPNGKYFMTYEFYGAVEAAFAVYYRVSDSPLTFNSAPGLVIKATDGTVPVSSPYNVWTPVGGKNGTIVVSCGTLGSVFLNRAQAAEGSAWEEVSTLESTSYTRSLLVMSDSSKVLITGGGVLGGENNSVTTTLFDVSKVSKRAALEFSS